MAKRVLWIGLLVILLMTVLAPAVLAQGPDGDKVIVGEDFVLLPGQELNGNLAVIAGSARLEAQSVVKGDVAVMGGSLTIAGIVRGNVAVFGGRVSLADTAVVEGDFAGFTAAVERAPGAIVRGDSMGLPRAPMAPDWSSRPSRSGFAEALLAFLRWQAVTVGWAMVLAFLGVVALLVAPRHVAEIATALVREPALSLGIGLLTLVVGLLGGGILLIACGLGLLVWLALAFGLLVGWIAIGLWLGKRALGALKLRDRSALAEVALGVVVITVAARLPLCIGFLFTVIAGAIGLGAVVLTRFGTQPASRWKA